MIMKEEKLKRKGSQRQLLIPEHGHSVAGRPIELPEFRHYAQKGEREATRKWEW